MEAIMTADKQPIFPHLIRKVPEQFSWVDHRLVRECYIDHLNHQASALYLFLVTVGDNQGLSYYGDKTLCKRLQMDAVELENARKFLIDNRLIAYRKPLYQVLALEVSRPLQMRSEPTSLGQILQQMAGGAR
jgi:hypothetical protein